MSSTDLQKAKKTINHQWFFYTWLWLFELAFYFWFMIQHILSFVAGQAKHKWISVQNTWPFLSWQYGIFWSACPGDTCLSCKQSCIRSRTLSCNFAWAPFDTCAHNGLGIVALGFHHIPLCKLACTLLQECFHIWIASYIQLLACNHNDPECIHNAKDPDLSKKYSFCPMIHEHFLSTVTGSWVFNFTKKCHKAKLFSLLLEKQKTWYFDFTCHLGSSAVKSKIEFEWTREIVMK